MAEYREMNMVPAALQRTIFSLRPNFNGSPEYTLNRGHVKFFYNKGRFLQRRYCDLVYELQQRGYDLDASRLFEVSPWALIPPLWGEYVPTASELLINAKRIHERVMAKPEWYRHRGVPLASDNVWLQDPTTWPESQLIQMLYVK